MSRESIRFWVNRFGGYFSSRIPRNRPAPSVRWHLDEVFIPFRGKKHWLWRAVDANGDTLDILVLQHATKNLEHIPTSLYAPEILDFRQRKAIQVFGGVL